MLPQFGRRVVRIIREFDICQGLGPAIVLTYSTRRLRH